MNADALQARLLASRESIAEVGGYRFRIRRPTEMQIAVLADERHRMELSLAMVIPAIVGWEGVLERDIIPGESDQPAPFSAELARMWIEDRPDLFAGLQEALMRSITDYRKRQDDALKNSTTS